MVKTFKFGEESKLISFRVPMSKDKEYREKIQKFIDNIFNGKTLENNNELLDKLVLLMIKAKINSDNYRIEITENDILPSINRLKESGLLG